MWQKRHWRKSRGIEIRDQKIDVVNAFKHDYNSADP